jgi:hypothetical protein
METPVREATDFRTWLIIFLLVVMIFSIGAFSYMVVGDQGQPDWDYRPVKDVPGESSYSIYRPLPYSQHVRGSRGD